MRAKEKPASALVLQKQLDHATAEIAALRKLTDHTLAIIISIGGTLVVPNTLVERTHSGAEWRHEYDSETNDHTFKAWLKPGVHP